MTVDISNSRKETRNAILKSHNCRGGLVVRASASRAEGRGFDPRLRQTFKKLVVVAFPHGAQGYGNSTTTVRIMDWLSAS